MNSARAFAVIAEILAGFAFLGSLASLLPSARSKGLLVTVGLLSLVICFCQGLTLLLLSSSACNNLTGFELTGVTCSMGKGAKVSVSAIVLWFVASLATAATIKSMGSPSETETSGQKEAEEAVKAEAEAQAEVEEPQEQPQPTEENA